MSTINKNQLVREISMETGFTQKDILDVMECAGNLILDHIRERDVVKPFDGVIFYGDMMENHIAYDFRTSESTIVDQLILPKVRFTGYAKNRIRGIESYYSRKKKKLAEGEVNDKDDNEGSNLDESDELMDGNYDDDD